MKYKKYIYIRAKINYYYQKVVNYVRIFPLLVEIKPEKSQKP